MSEALQAQGLSQKQHCCLQQRFHTDQLAQWAKHHRPKSGFQFEQS